MDRPYYPLSYRFVAQLLSLLFHKITIIEHTKDFQQLPHPVIFAYNHNNYFETAVLSSYLMRHWPQGPICFMVDWMYGQLPFIGWLVQGVQPIYVYNKPARWEFLNRRKGGARPDPIQEGVARLRQGYSVGIFPEGSRNGHPYLLKRGRLGVGELALEARVPVLPVGIDFPGRARRGRIPTFGRIILRFGQPLNFLDEITAWQRLQEDHRLAPAQRQKGRLLLCRQITHTIMRELARLCGKQYPYRQPSRPATWPPQQQLGERGTEDGKNRHPESA
jgi:1-acyl-sn-glycerol-3-phosphate acyltransferase